MNNKTQNINVSSVLARHEKELASIPEASNTKRTSGYWFLMGQLNAINNQVQTLSNQSASLIASMNEIKSLPVVDRDMDEFDSIEQLNMKYLCINKVNKKTFDSLKLLMKSQYDIDFIGRKQSKVSRFKPSEKHDYSKVMASLS